MNSPSFRSVVSLAEKEVNLEVENATTQVQTSSVPSAREMQRKSKHATLQSVHVRKFAQSNQL